MIRIKINDKDLDTGGIRMSFKFTNPLFSDKIFSDGYSFPFSLKETPNNISILSNSNRLDNKRIKRNFFIKIYFENNFLFSGILNIKSITNGNINCYFNSRGLDIAKNLSEINLRNLDLYRKTVCVESDAPLTKQDKWQTRIVAQSQLVAYKRPEDVITHYFPPIHCPFAYDTDITRDSGETATGFVKNHWWSQFINFHYWNGSKYLTGNRVLNSVYTSRPGWQTTISPCPNFVYVLDNALSRFGYILDKTSLLALEEVANLFIFSNNVLDKIEATASYTYNVYGYAYDLADFLPNISAIELPKALKQFFKAVFYEQDGRIKVIAGKDLINQNALDLSDYTEYAYNKEFSELYNYEFEFSETTGDRYFKLFSDQFEKVKIDNGQDATVPIIKPTASRPLATRFNPRGRIWGTWTTPAQDETSIGSLAGSLLAEFENPTSLGHDAQVKSDESDESPTDIIETLLLGVWRGENFTSPTYPSAVNQSVDDLGNRYGDLSILFGGDDGLVEVFQKPFYDFINGASLFTKQLYLPAHKLAKFIQFEQIKYSFKHPNGNLTGIIRDFEFELSNEGISPIKATFLQHEND